MKANLGNIDRGLRAVLGVALILLGLLAGLTGWGQWAALLVGAVLVLTALSRFCPAYALFGISSCGRK
ncbi:Protein of unknown function [Paracoccus aminovorans]|uniref:Inner membrane protein YgaP-like transmembrane domain-containing protein n=1 Tax=Paracoccus aminovorans TaxID=34004 RepID=A0A1I2X7J7_9RHOB|nr:DUF2892 domain-containing protein [Paracoccus aminovorans]CQR85561.1 putative membrane protein [Paracoccus aminovorans]SFH09520.1 Protein of unknown function [Paracoccus aminovorans]